MMEPARTSIFQRPVWVTVFALTAAMGKVAIYNSLQCKPNAESLLFAEVKPVLEKFFCKVTHFCPILTTFVPRIRNIYKNRNDSADRNHIKAQVSRLSLGDQRDYATVAQTA